jgi:hypothetical protein
LDKKKSPTERTGSKLVRNIFLILIIAVLALIAAVATGFLDISQTQKAAAPSISVDGDGVTATGGQAPEFKAETGSVTLGSQPANVTVNVPQVQVNPPAEAAPPPPGNSQ